MFCFMKSNFAYSFSVSFLTPILTLFIAKLPFSILLKKLLFTILTHLLTSCTQVLNAFALVFF